LIVRYPVEAQVAMFLPTGAASFWLGDPAWPALLVFVDIEIQ
jgi:hypothetical protein